MPQGASSAATAEARPVRGDRVRSVQPEFREWVDAAKVAPNGPLSIDEERHGAEAMCRELWGPVEKVPGISQILLDGDLGCRVYEREKTNLDVPCIVFFHGGGWSLGSLDSHDGLCRALSNRASAVVDPVASLLRAGDWAGTAPTLIVIAEFDPLRDEGVRFAELLELSGVSVAYCDLAGTPHGFILMNSISEQASETIAWITSFLKEVWK